MFLAVVVPLYLALSGGKCGTPCAVDSACTGDKECSQCIKPENATLGACGVACGMNCTEDSHCVDSTCSTCKGGVCSMAPPPPGNLTCGDVCTNDDECHPGVCAQCVISLGTKVGHCGAGCGMNCTNNTECQNTACSLCDPFLHTCQPAPSPPQPPSPPNPSNCSKQCVVDTECSGECFQCIIKKGATIGECGDGCGMNCANDSHCLNVACPVCNTTNGICVSAAPAPPSPTPGRGQCRDPCKNNDECDPHSKCNKCIILGGASHGVCGVACGEFCSESSQCVDEMCAVCDKESGTCEAPVPPAPHARCLSPCAVNTDCVGLCRKCISGHCRQGCGDPCIVNADCGSPGCRVCSAVTFTCTP